MKSCTQEEVDAYQLAIYLGEEELKEKCENFIRYYPHAIFDMDDFCRWDRIVHKEMLKLVLSNCNEVHILNACIKWAKFRCRRDCINDKKPENWRAHLGLLWIDAFGIC